MENTEIKSILNELNAYINLVLNKLVASNINCNLRAQAVVTPAVQGFRFWKDVELLNDKGLVGYFLADEINSQAFMAFCSKDINYTSKEFLPNLELVYALPKK